MHEALPLVPLFAFLGWSWLVVKCVVVRVFIPYAQLFSHRGCILPTLQAFAPESSCRIRSLMQIAWDWNTHPFVNHQLDKPFSKVGCANTICCQQLQLILQLCTVNCNRSHHAHVTKLL
jgi:hypothetical protein